MLSPSGPDLHSYGVAVGSHPEGASPYGALDLSGNVWEWVADWYSSNYYERAPRRNPQGPTSGWGRSVRGGSWYLNPRYARASNRNGDYPDTRLESIGFRCAQ